MEDLIKALIANNYLKSPEIIKAFREIDRKDFVLPENKEQAAINEPLPIGCGQTVSQPLTVAFMLELLRPQAGDKILDIGCGSGWTTSLLSHIATGQGKVYGLEIIPELYGFAVKNVGKYGFLEKGTAEIFLADGSKGLPKHAPFDRIIVSAAADTIPAALPEQLKIGGRLLIPVGKAGNSQDMVLIKREGKNDFKSIGYPGFIFVPLVKNNK